MARGFKKVIKINNTPAMKSYKGCGYGYIIIKNEIPQTIIYSPDRTKQYEKSIIKIDEKNKQEIFETTKVYSGITGIDEFVATERIFPPISKLKELRKEKGILQKELAEAANVNITYIQKLESGEKQIENVSLKIALELSKKLNVNIKDLF